MKKLGKGSIAGLLCIILSIGAFVAFVHYSGINTYVSLESLQQHGQSLRISVQQHYTLAITLFLLIYIALITVMPFVVPLTLMGGFLFGSIAGFFLSIFAATMGSVISFLIIRTFIGPIMRKRYQTKLQEFAQKMQHYGSSYLLTLNLLSVIPYIIIDTLAALSGISLITFIWTFALGNIPIISILSYTGQQLSTITSFGDIFTTPILVGFGALALLALLPIILKKYKE